MNKYGISESYVSSTCNSTKKKNEQESKGYVYQKSSYQYSNSENNNVLYKPRETGSNIDQLDKLLLDLKNEREHTKEIDLVSPSIMNKTNERERSEPLGNVNKTLHVVKALHESTANTMPLEIEHFTSPDRHTSTPSVYSSSQRIIKRDDFQMSDHSHAPERSFIRPDFEGKNQSCTFENSDNHSANLSPASFSEDMKNIALSSDIMPAPGVKVTTTVRTYTYEIPADPPTNEMGSNTPYKNNTIQVNRLKQPPPLTVVYNTESYSTARNAGDRPNITSLTKETRDQVDKTNNNDFNSLSRYLPDDLSIGANKTNIIYKVDTSENIQSPSETAYKRNATLQNKQGMNYPQGSTPYNYYYQESSKIRTYNGRDCPENPKELISPKQILPQIGYSAHVDEQTTNVPPISSTFYNYSSKTTNSSHVTNYESQPHHSQPAPFPVDGHEFSASNGNPPQKVDDLMQSFGNGDTIDKSEIQTLPRKREIETAVASPNQSKIPTINKAGKEVYYPPGHDMMLARRGEIAAAAGGRWAKASGMYEYESGYKSKSKMKSGGAVVPVCLPLCCAMPCSLM